jgi:peptide alpha-N-acetyltransferase
LFAQIVLETEFDNNAALSLYASLGFIREKRLHRFYLNGKDAFRLVLPIVDNDADDFAFLTSLGDRTAQISLGLPSDDEEEDPVSMR